MPPPTPDQQKKLDAFDRAVDEIAPAYAAALVRAFNDLQDTISVDVLADALGRSDRHGAQKAAGLDAIERYLRVKTWPHTKKALRRGAQIARADANVRQPTPPTPKASKA